MRSPFLIPDKLKKWQEFEFTPEIFDMRLLNFFMVEKNSNYSGLLEINTTRPFLINCENTKKIVFEYNGDLYVDVSQNLNVMLLLWNDMEETHKEEYLLSEASNFQDLCMDNFKQLLVELSNVATLPLNYRPKIAQEEQIEENTE